MSDDTARAVGANGAIEITIGGKLCTVRPLKIKELGEMERICLKQWKREIMETYTDNVDLLPEEKRERLIVSKLDEISKLDVHDLPTRRVYDPFKIKVTPKLEDWTKQNYQSFIELADGRDDSYKKRLIQRIVTTALDKETLSEAACTELTGSQPVHVQVGYVNWWITATFEGQLEMIYMAFKHNGVTRDDVCDALSDNPAVMIELSRELEHLTAPSDFSGN